MINLAYDICFVFLVHESEQKVSETQLLNGASCVCKKKQLYNQQDRVSGLVANYHVFK